MPNTAVDILENLKSSIIAAIRYIKDHPGHPFENLVNWIDMLEWGQEAVEEFFDPIIRDFPVLPLPEIPEVKVIAKLVPLSAYQLKKYDLEVYN